MENQPMMLPFQLHRKASLRRVLESYRENLDWHEIDLITEETYNQEAFFKNAAEGHFSLYRVKEIILPEKSGQLFLAYVRDILRDFEARVTKLVRDRPLLHDQKLKTLALCKRLALEAEVKNDITNPVKRALNFDWKAKGEDGHFYSIPYGYLVLGTFQQGIEEEFRIRHSFFQWLRERLDAAIQELDQLEFHDPLVKWEAKDAKTKIGEVFYALRKSGLFEFVDLEAQKVFEAYIAKLFSLGEVDFRKIEGEIRRRGGKEKGVKSKWYFLEELIRLPL